MLFVFLQTYDDARSLARRQSYDGESRRHHHSSVSDRGDHLLSTSSETSPHVCNIFATSNVTDPFDTILSEQQEEKETHKRHHHRQEKHHLQEELENYEEKIMETTGPDPPTSLPTIAEPVLFNTTPTSHSGVFLTKTNFQTNLKI
jgi:hypothetical protein